MSIETSVRPMKRIVIILLLLLCVSSKSFSQVGILRYPAEATPAGADILYLVKSPGGAGTDRHLLVSNVTKALSTWPNDLLLGGGATASELRFLEPSGSGVHYSAFKAQAQAGNITYLLPAADAAGVLTNNGSGALTWGTAGVVDIASYATGGSGTVGSPWTGWDTAITWTVHTEYRFRKGYFAFATSPAWTKTGIALIGDAGGTYLIHTGSGNAFVMDTGETLWTHGMRVENLFVVGNYVAGAGTASATSSSATIVGVGTSFLSAVSVGDTITFRTRTSAIETHVVTEVTDNTHLTFDTTWIGSFPGETYVIGKTTKGFYLRGIRDSAFRQCATLNVGIAGFWTEACVTNILENPRCTLYGNETDLDNGWGSLRTQYGIVTTARNVTDFSTVWTIINPVVEYCNTIGIWFKSGSFGNTVIGGTSEGHTGSCVGLQLDSSSHTISNMAVESNDSPDNVVINGSKNQLTNVITDDVTTINGSHNIITGGTYPYITITQASGGYYNTLQAVKVSVTFTDDGNRTQYYGIDSASFLTKLGVVQPVLQAPSVGGGGIVVTNIALGDVIAVDAFENFTLSNPSVTTPVNGQTITYRVLGGGGARTITYGDKFRAPYGTLPASVRASEYLYTRFTYNATSLTWDMHSLSPEQLHVAAPASASAAGVVGQEAWDADYRYTCVATNTWKRVAHATW